MQGLEYRRHLHTRVGISVRFDTHANINVPSSILATQRRFKKKTFKQVMATPGAG